MWLPGISCGAHSGSFACVEYHAMCAQVGLCLIDAGKHMSLVNAKRSSHACLGKHGVADVAEVLSDGMHATCPEAS